MDATGDGEHDECVPNKSTKCVISERYDLNLKRITLHRPEASGFISKIEWSTYPCQTW